MTETSPLKNNGEYFNPSDTIESMTTSTFDYAPENRESFTG